MLKPVLTGLAILAISQSVYAADDYAAGVKAYSDGDFGTSIRLLTSAIKGVHSKDATAYYYLGNAYLQLKNNSAALFEYRECLRLAPQAESAQHCLKAIEHLTGGAVPPQIAVVRSVPTSIPKGAPSTSVVAPIKVMGLPTIPTFTKEDGPSLSEVLTWPLGQQASYFQVAFDRKNEALLRLERVQDTFKRAQSLAASAVGSARQFGETDEAMKVRIAGNRSQMALILKPFEEAVEVRQKDVEHTNQIYETCVSAGRRSSGY